MSAVDPGIGIGHLATMPSLFNWIQQVPKAELHLHLEGAIPINFLRDLSTRNSTDFAGLVAGFQYSNFPDFIRQWMRVIDQFRQPEDFCQLVVAVSQTQAEAGIRYTEAFFSPFDYPPGRFLPETITRAVIDGVRMVNQAGKTRMAVLADLVRNHGGAGATNRLLTLKPFFGAELIGIGLGGSERGFEDIDFADAFSVAREWGIRTVAHAGETMGAERVLSAITILGASRIGHGIHAGGDPAVVSLLKERNIPLEIAFTSNRMTGAWPGDLQHPAADLISQGVQLTINTDDPTFFSTTMQRECEAAIAQGISESALISMLRNNWVFSFLPDAEKQLFLAEFDRTIRQIRPS